MSLIVILAVVGVVVVLLAVWELYMRSQPVYRAASCLPGKRIYPVIGNILEGRKLIDGASSFRHAVEMSQTFRRGYRFVLFNRLHYWPTLGHEIEFLFNSTNNSNKSFFYSFLVPMMGEGLLISNGAKWSQRRKILTPAFHFNILQKFLHIFKEESSTFVCNLATEEHNPEGREINDMISRFTLNNICETAMGVKLNSHTEPDNYRGMIYRSGELLLKRYLNPMLYNDFLFSLTSGCRELLRCVRLLHGFSGSVIEQRRNANRKLDDNAGVDSENIYEKSRYAMLDTLLEAETNGQIDSAGIREEVDTFMFEGYDTTSCGLNFCLLIIGTYQNVQSRIYEELLEVVAQCGGDSNRMSIHDYNKLTYMDMVIKETFRLYPPVPYISRQLNEPVELTNVTLPAGTQVHLFIYNLHRDPAQFPDPERFDPDRFAPANAEHRHPFAYIPFSAGTRNCIGQKFAMLEIKCLLAKLVLAYRLEAVTKREEMCLISDLVLRTEEPIRMKFIKRGCDVGV